MSMTTSYWINSTPRPEILLLSEFVHTGNTTLINWRTKPSSLEEIYFGAKLTYYPNSESCFQLTRINKSRNISTNLGPTVENTSRVSSIRKVCAGCLKALGANHNGVECSSCSWVLHYKCSAMSRKDLSIYLSIAVTELGVALLAPCLNFRIAFLKTPSTTQIAQIPSLQATSLFFCWLSSSLQTSTHIIREIWRLVTLI